MTDVRAEMVKQLDPILRSSQRRDFLKLAAMGGMGVFIPAVMTGCKDESFTDPMVRATFTMGTSSGPLNMIYAYAQFMVDFYARVYTEQSKLHFPDMTQKEYVIFQMLKAQKQMHADALRRLVAIRRISDALLYDFSSVTFLDRASVMGAAQTFEDLGVAMITGVTPSFTNATDLTLASKIASVWARHSALIRDMNYVTGLAPSRAVFSGDDVVDVGTGLNTSNEPGAFVAAAQPYFITTLSVG